MRNLTIKREKSVAGCLVKMKVYISDMQSNEIVISGIPCRKLGELKNGEEKTFSIDENAAKIFVIADRLSKEFCSDSCSIPAGAEAVVLSGKNRFNPITGNPFRFNGVEPDESTRKRRKKAFRRGALILAVSAVVGVIAGWIIGTSIASAKKAEPKVFSEEGLQITLTDEFVQVDPNGYTVCYSTNKAVVLALKEEFFVMEGLEDYSLEEYGKLVLENNQADSGIKVQTADGLTYFEYIYEDESTKVNYYYFCVVCKGTDAFWIVHFVSNLQDYGTLRPNFIQWAKTIEVQ